MRHLLLLLLSVALPEIAHAGPPAWTTIEHFGMNLSVPSYIVDAPGIVTFDPPDSDNVQMTTFEPTHPQRSLRMYLLHNDETPLKALLDVWSSAATTYRTGRPNMAVISGTTNDPGAVFYARCAADRGAKYMVCFDIDYPASDKAEMDPVVAKMSASFGDAAYRSDQPLLSRKP
jgi:hypothetical protein